MTYPGNAINTYDIAIDPENLDALMNAVSSCQGTSANVWVAYDPATGKFIWRKSPGNRYVIWTNKLVSLGSAMTTDKQQLIIDLVRKLGTLPTSDEPR